MSVQTNGDAGQAPGAGTPPSGQAPAAQQDQQGTQQPGQGQAPAAGEFDLSTIQDPALRAYLETQQAELRRARSEAAQFRTAKTAAEQQVQQFQRQSETAEQAAQREAQERQARLDTLEQENRTLRVTQAIGSSAKDAHNPSVVASMIASQVTLDDKGNPTNVDALIAGLRQSDPYLFRITPGGADAGAGRQPGASPAGGSVGSSINDLVRQGGRGIPVR